MKIFGTLHLTILAVIAAIAILLIQICRREVVKGRVVFACLGMGIAINEIIWWIWRYSREGIRPTNLPLQLCDAAVWVSVIACLTRVQWVAEFCYFIGIAGAGMALITPDLWAPWPQWPAVYFFLAHGGVVIAALLMAFSGTIQFHPRSVWRPFGLLLSFSAFAGIIDAITGANYMYLRERPKGGSLLDVMGPWPWYIAGAMGLALVLFFLLWLPVREKQDSSGVDGRKPGVGLRDGTQRSNHKRHQIKSAANQ